MSSFHLAIAQKRCGDWNDAASADLIFIFRTPGNDLGSGLHIPLCNCRADGRRVQQAYVDGSQQVIKKNPYVVRSRKSVGLALLRHQVTYIDLDCRRGLQRISETRYEKIGNDARI